jgi:hypothetical protein
MSEIQVITAGQTSIVEVATVGESNIVEVTTRIGPAGVGVPSGGATGQILVKHSDSDFDTEWLNAESATNLDCGTFN